MRPALTVLDLLKLLDSRWQTKRSTRKGRLTLSAKPADRVRFRHGRIPHRSHFDHFLPQINSGTCQFSPATIEASSFRSTRYECYEQSCKAFVQRFYDWYWNRFADRIDHPNFQFPGDHDISLQEPPIISKEIFQLIDNYEKRIDNPKTNPDGGNSVLEYGDPYLNSDNGAHGKYLVVQVAVSGDRCLATVRGSTNVQPELKKVRQSWLIVNFHYPDAKRKSESSLIDELSP